MARKESRRGFIKNSLKYLAGLYMGLLFGIKGIFDPPEIKAANGTDVAWRCSPRHLCAPACSPTCTPTCTPSCTPSCSPTCYPCAPNCSPTCSPSCAPYCNPTCPPAGACSMIEVDVPLIDIQRALKVKGYYNGPVDGVWNKETWIAIIEFKRANGLQPNGVVTPATWDLLKP
ncbi:MAG: peptidoglycan-binding protein [Deltaproteobacteria bacterium]|nr:peptidoglycan-binding protein [Deltaproteobacteria bacterium]